MSSVREPSSTDCATGGGIFRKGVWGGAHGTLFPDFDTMTSKVHAASDHAAIYADKLSGDIPIPPGNTPARFAMAPTPPGDACAMIPSRRACADSTNTAISHGIPSAWPPRRKTVVVNHPYGAAQMLNAPTGPAYRKEGTFYQPISDLFGNGLVIRHGIDKKGIDR